MTRARALFELNAAPFIGHTATQIRGGEEVPEPPIARRRSVSVGIDATQLRLS
jgi:hypothetical protein